MEKSLVGHFILDNGKLGLVVNEISYTTLSPDEKAVWQSSYEIKYFDGSYSLINKSSLHKLIEIGRIKLLGESS